MRPSGRMLSSKPGASCSHSADIQPEGGDTHVRLGEERCPNSSQVLPSTKPGRTYYKWSNETTSYIKDIFSEWFSLPEGKRLPSKPELVKFIAERQLECSTVQLRTQIMNEQKKQQQLFKKRWLSMKAD